METTQLWTHRFVRQRSRRNGRVKVSAGALWAALILLAQAGMAQAQTDIRQSLPFEGPTSPITLCNGSPDIGPAFGSTVVPHTGSNFVGFHESLQATTNNEIFSIPIDRVLASGTSYRYRFMARIAPINPNTNPGWLQNAGGANSGSFVVYAGATACAQTQAIGAVSLTWPGDDVWTLRTFTFTANAAHRHFTFVAASQASATGSTYFGVDDPRLDYGDAPNSFGTLLSADGARHELVNFNATNNTAPLMLGGNVSPEADGRPDPAASLDTFDDGVVAVTLVTGATTANVNVTAVNTTASDATLVGWIDFNSGGTFGSGAERAQITVPANTNTPTQFTLNWSGLPPIPANYTGHARFRIATNAAELANPTGLASDGEVEDYRVPIQDVPPSFGSCDTRAFLFQNAPTDVFAVDLVTGAAPQVANDIVPANINAVGYNPLDDYIYGVDSAIGGTGLIRVGSDFTVQTLGFPTGMPTTLGFNVGEFDNNGHYWVNSGATGNVYEVDMRPGSATYFQVVSSRALNVIAGFNGGADWAFNPVDGFLYRTPMNTTTGRLHLFRYNRATGVQTNLGAIAGIAADATILVGANYSDAAGFVYGSDNTSGRIFRINTTAIAGALLSTGPLSGTNDGARCFNAPVPIDFGDAPNSYGTLLANNGARHSVPGYDAATNAAPLMLGDGISIENDGTPNTTAQADSLDDGVVAASVSLVTGATTASVGVRVVNATAAAATLAGWIDFNGSGTFEAGERAQVTVPANTATATEFTLNWAGLSPIPAGFSGIARFRIATNAAQVANPVGAAADGEVEDYTLPVIIGPPACNLAANGSFELPNIQGDPANPEPGTQYVNGWAVWRTSQATIDGWQVVAGTVDILRYFNNASDGLQSIDLWGTAPSTVQQTFTGLTPGQQYTFSADYSGLSTTTSIADVHLDRGTGFQLIQTLTPVADGVNNGNGGLPNTPSFTVTWATYAHSFIATGTQATIRFVNRVAPGPFNTGVFIDNFVFGGDAPCEDFGDAPASFGTLEINNGARHEVLGYDPTTHVAELMLGDGVTIEADGQPDSAAAIDAFDDGVVASTVSLLAGSTTAAAGVRAVNATANDVTLAGWVDFDGSGTFEAGERAQVTVPANTTTATEFMLNWSGLAPIPANFSGIARFRIATAAVDVAAAAGAAVDGEVEDYVLPILVVDPLITIVKVPTALNGTVFPFTTTAPAPDDSFDLSNTTTLTRSFSVAPGTVDITEAALADWVLTDIACVNDVGTATVTYTGATVNPTSGFERGDDTVEATVDFGDEVTCTYINSPTGLPTLVKYFNTDPPSSPPPLQPPVVTRGDTALLTFVIDNTQSASGNQTGLGFTDTLPSGLVLADGDGPPSALVGANTCGGAVTAQSGTAAITLAGGAVAASAQCSFTVRVTTAP